MTRSKIEFATILATMRGQGEDPKQLAQDMSLRKLCYEIEKLEQEQEQESPKETTPKVEEPPKETKKTKGPRPFWSWLLADSDDEDS
jgi:hypothetical protein